MRLPYTSLSSAYARWLTPQVWKEARRDRRLSDSRRWNLHALLMVLLLMTWTSGESEAERFATAQAFYVACHQHEKRPGGTLQGFHKALAKVPLPVLRALLAGVRRNLAKAFQRVWRTGEFLVMACDASRLECPRSAALEKALKPAGKKDSAPTLFVSALVLLPAGLLWNWRVGPGCSSEAALLRPMLKSLPRRTLLVADAYYQGYELYRDMIKQKVSFLVRLSSRSRLYTESKVPLERFREGLVWYWPEKMQAQGEKPLRLRLIRVRGRKRQDVWLLTNVLESVRLSRRQAAVFYAWRWHIEGVFRDYKRTLPKIKLRSRTKELLDREAEMSLLALQLLQAQAAKRQHTAAGVILIVGSPRQELLRVRGLITTTIGSKLGPRQQRAYRLRLARVAAGGATKKTRRSWPRRKKHKAPKPPQLKVMTKRFKAKILKRLQAA